MNDNKEINTIINKDDLKQSFFDMGINQGDVIELAVNLDKLDYIVGGCQTLIDALIEILTPDGTLVISCLFKDNREPFKQDNPVFCYEIVDSLRANMPSFNPLINISYSPLVDSFRLRDSVLYSKHPYYCFAAWGKYASFIINRQSLHFGLGEDSPTARLVELRSKYLCIGCGIDQLMSMRLAQVRSETCPIELDGACIENNGYVLWKKYLDYQMDSSQFNAFIPQLLALGKIHSYLLNKTQCYVGQVDELVAHYTNFLENRSPLKYYR